MKVILSCIIFSGMSFTSNSQTKQHLSDLIEQVSNEWKNDSNSCKGYRLTVAQTILRSQIDSLSKRKLYLKLGKPNRIQKFYSGVTNKNYVGYIYYTYKDNCPKITLDGRAIQFVFDESETTLLEITEIEFCG